MRVIIAGGRDITDEHAVYDAIARSPFFYQITGVICGGATGVDDLGDKFAFEVGLPVDYWIVTDAGYFDWSRLRSMREDNVQIASDWRHDGDKAGPMRNALMANHAVPGGALILVWDGKSLGSRSMRRIAKLYGLSIYEEVIHAKGEKAAERRHPHVAQHATPPHRPTLPQTPAQRGQASR